MDIQQIHQIFLSCNAITTDSRKIETDSLFFALKGDNFDGNKFASQALERGALYAIVDEADSAIDQRFILVDNVLETLQNLANYHRKQMSAYAIAITGTNGKTTTKELISAVLRSQYNVVATQGNLNNHIGVPLTLLSIKNDTQIAVVEMGANHIGEIAQLCDIAEPDFGIITNIGKAHLEGFGSFDGVIQAKSELYQYLAKDNKPVFVNQMNEVLMTAAANAGLSALITYGQSDKCIYSGRVIEANPLLILEWHSVNEQATDINKHTIQTQLAGAYNFENVMAAIACGKFFSIDDDLIDKSIQSYKPTMSRSQIINTMRNTVLMDAYNANPTSMQTAIANFYPQIPLDKKVLILGDMLELGAYADAEHQNIYNLVADKDYAHVIMVGKFFKRQQQSASVYHFINTDDLKEWLQTNPLMDFYILVKGSRGVQLEKILELL